MNAHPPRRYLLKTLGCKANLYDSQLLEAELHRRGWIAADDEQGAQLCIVNSCTVTDEADRQSRKLAARLCRDNPEARVVVTGCAAEVEPERLASSRGVHYVVGNQDKPRLVELVLRELEEKRGEPRNGPDAPGEVLGGVRSYEQMASRHPMDREWDEPESAFRLPPVGAGGEAGRTRAFLKIQEGCNAFCTYCVIPYGRGPSRSLRIPELVEQVRRLTEQGVREVVLTGTNIGDYGVDWAHVGAARREGLELVALAEALIGQTSLERLRVSSLDPVEITPELMELMAREPRLCPHFHVSLQSPHGRILRLMKRKYGAEDVRRCLESIARIPAPPGGVFVGMDVITGFPGETEEEFEWGRKVLAELPWTRLHVFPYSERQGTPATRLPGSVPQPERTRRAMALRELSLERLTQAHRQVLDDSRRSGRPIQRVLLEARTRGPDGSRDWYCGYSDNYLRVLVPAPAGAKKQGELSNHIVAVEPISLAVDREAGDVGMIGRVLNG